MNEPKAISNQQQALDRIRQALGRSETAQPVPLAPFLEESGEAEREALVGRFTREVSAVVGQVHRAQSAEEAINRIAQICHDAGVAEVALSGSPLLAEMDLQAQLARRDLRMIAAAEFHPSEHENLIARLAGCGAGVTAVDYAIAETGTIALSSDEEGGLLVSLLPPIHIALVRPRQINSSLAEGLSQLTGDRAWRSATFITGPSRTSDVELTLSIGVHGPKQLHLILLDD